MKKKRILYGILGIAVILIICGAFFLWYGKKGDAQPEEDGEKVSRQEWIKTLGEHSGATEGSDEEDYFSDVDTESEYYPYVQAAADWDFIDKGEEEFKGEENATGEFIAVTALKSIGEPKIQRYLGTEEALKKKDYVKLALDLKLVDKKQLKRGLSEDEVRDVIKKLDEHYYDTFWPKDLDEVEYQDNVRQLEEGTVTAFNEERGILQTTEKLKEGEVITFQKDGFVVIRKVISILEDGSYELGVPEMEEVFKILKQSGVSELTFQDIVNYYGEENLVTAQAETSETNAAMMSAGTWNTSEWEGFKIEVEEEDGKLKIYYTDNKTGMRLEMPIAPELPQKLKNFSASIEIQKMIIASQMEYSWKDGLKYANVVLNTKADFKGGATFGKIYEKDDQNSTPENKQNGTVKKGDGAENNQNSTLEKKQSGTVKKGDGAENDQNSTPEKKQSGTVKEDESTENDQNSSPEKKQNETVEDEEADSKEKIVLFKTKKPIGNGIIGVDVQVYLVITAKGEIYLEAEIPIGVSQYYEKGKGYRKPILEYTQKEWTFRSNTELEAKGAAEPILVVGQFMPIIDAEISVGIKGTMDVASHENGQCCVDVVAAYPLITFSVGETGIEYPTFKETNEKTDSSDQKQEKYKSLIAQLGISKEWELINEENAWKSIHLHYETYPDGTEKFVNGCTYQKKELDEELMSEIAKFAGTYKATDAANAAYGEGEALLDLIVLDDGRLRDGGIASRQPILYPNQQPMFVEKRDDGSYLCIITDSTDYVQCKYYIYPQGVVEEKFADDSYLVNTVYIHVFQSDDEEAFDIIYYQNPEEQQTDSEKSNEGNIYMTNEPSIPTMMFEYPDSWYIDIDAEECESDYESVILKNERGAEINYYSSEMEFSRYYGGYHEVQYAHMTKVADASFENPDQKEPYVVAKIKVYAYDDGMTEDGTVIYDGATYYAVVPERYLGDQDFCGTGYMGVCAFDCGRSIVMLAAAPDGVFEEKEEDEVIQILSSFQVKE